MKSGVQVKICGITNRADAETALTCGADALGFNFYPGSARCIGLTEARQWLPQLPAGVLKIAVLVNQPELGLELWQSGLVNALQLHGDEDAAVCAALADAGAVFSKAIRVRDASSLAQPERWRTARLVFDAYQAGAYGGTGERMDWELAARFVASHPQCEVMLSGGLTPENVSDAVRIVHPRAVDVASGVEVAGNPRRKDAEKMCRFVMSAKSALGDG
ncbi:MAG: phosphoribosylanthranilate isomerase [Verrucomicrobia bacterium]|nr:phosphoribosylanthranilate isomerase [Verrucomicrobiota bacterium]